MDSFRGGVNNLYTPRNAGFETGDLTGWTVKNPSHFRKSTAVISAMDYDMEYKLNGADRLARLPYNQVGNYHLSGRDVNLSEDATWELCSSPFTLAGSGYISVKMGGSSAAFRVRTVENNLVVAYCKQLRYNDINFPYLSKGGSWWDMATYVMDLSPFLGQKMAIELLDEEVDAAWAHAFFDDIVTLYPKRPTTLSDTVIDGYDLWSDETKEINIPWIYLDVYGDVIGRFPPGPSTMKDISGEVGPQSFIDLYEYFMAKQGMSASELKKANWFSQACGTTTMTAAAGYSARTSRTSRRMRARMSLNTNLSDGEERRPADFTYLFCPPRRKSRKRMLRKARRFPTAILKPAV